MSSFNKAIEVSWAALKSLAASKKLPFQYVEHAASYEVFLVESPLTYRTDVYKDGAVLPIGVDAGANAANLLDFETNYKASANGSIDQKTADGTPIVAATQPDTRVIRRFGNLTTTSTNEVLVSARPYVELASQRQCSVQSTSPQDKAGGTGSVAVRIVYLDSNYVLKSEDVNLNGTTKVNTVATDIRFIEDFFVIQGPAAVGAIQLMDGITGGAAEFCGIGVGTTSAFLCQHYVPAGKTATILGWSTTVDDEVKFKVYDQLRYGANLVDNIVDLCNAMGITTPPGLISCDHTLQAVVAPEKSRIRITAVPNQATSTVIRATLYLLEVSL